jgi:hypothetical protein
MSTPNIEVIKEALLVRSTLSDFALLSIIGVVNTCCFHLKYQHPEVKKCAKTVLTFFNTRPISAESDRMNYHSARSLSGQPICLVDLEQAISHKLGRRSWRASGEVSQ